MCLSVNTILCLSKNSSGANYVISTFAHVLSFECRAVLWTFECRAAAYCGLLIADKFFILSWKLVLMAFKNLADVPGNVYDFVYEQRCSLAAYYLQWFPLRFSKRGQCI